VSQTTQCPICDAELTLDDDVVKDELLECPECGTELVVTSINPLAIEEAPQTEEDWGE
jgi:alpha-aminoadipate/glutamate carrier protein LysW